MSKRTRDTADQRRSPGLLVALVVLAMLAACVTVAAATDSDGIVPTNATAPNGTIPANETAGANTTLTTPAQDPAAVNGSAGEARPGPVVTTKLPKDKRVSQKDREAAATRVQDEYDQALITRAAQADPGGVPHYFGPYANWANSPMPRGPVGIVTVDAGGAGYIAPTV